MAAKTKEVKAKKDSSTKKVTSKPIPSKKSTVTDMKSSDEYIQKVINILGNFAIIGMTSALVAFDPEGATQAKKEADGFAARSKETPDQRKKFYEEYKKSISGDAIIRIGEMNQGIQEQITPVVEELRKMVSAPKFDQSEMGIGLNSLLEEVEKSTKRGLPDLSDKLDPSTMIYSAYLLIGQEKNSIELFTKLKELNDKLPQISDEGKDTKQENKKITLGTPINGGRPSITLTLPPNWHPYVTVTHYSNNTFDSYNNKLNFESDGIGGLESGDNKQIVFAYCRTDNTIDQYRSTFKAKDISNRLPTGFTVTENNSSKYTIVRTANGGFIFGQVESNIKEDYEASKQVLDELIDKIVINFNWKAESKFSEVKIPQITLKCSRNDVQLPTVKLIPPKNWYPYPMSGNKFTVDGNGEKLESLIINGLKYSETNERDYDFPDRTIEFSYCQSIKPITRLFKGETISNETPDGFTATNTDSFGIQYRLIRKKGDGFLIGTATVKKKENYEDTKSVLDGLMSKITLEFPANYQPMQKQENPGKTSTPNKPSTIETNSTLVTANRQILSANDPSVPKISIMLPSEWIKLPNYSDRLNGHIGNLKFDEWTIATLQKGEDIYLVFSFYKTINTIEDFASTFIGRGYQISNKSAEMFIAERKSASGLDYKIIKKIGGGLLVGNAIVRVAKLDQYDSIKSTLKIIFDRLEICV